MPAFEIRPFRRPDRDQVTDLVNAHAAAVVPGVAASVSTVLAQFEREPDEFVVDPWVASRQVLVAEQHGAVVAAALVGRYRADPDVGDWYRGAAEVRWIVFRPEAPAGNPWWADGREAAEALLAEVVRSVRADGVHGLLADGALPVPGVYGIPEQWPHVRSLLQDNGFGDGVLRTEVVHLLDVDDVDPPDGSLPSGSIGSVEGVVLRRSVGINGVRFAAVLAESDERIGYVEVEALGTAERHSPGAGIADVGNLAVAEPWRRRGVATWLLRHAVAWLRLGGVSRVLMYTADGEEALVGFARSAGFVEVTRTERGWRREP